MGGLTYVWGNQGGPNIDYLYITGWRPGERKKQTNWQTNKQHKQTNKQTRNQVAQISTTCTSPAENLEKKEKKLTNKQTTKIRWPKYRLPVHHQLETWRKKTIKATWLRPKLARSPIKLKTPLKGPGWWRTSISNVLNVEFSFSASKFKFLGIMMMIVHFPC